MAIEINQVREITSDFTIPALFLLQKFPEEDKPSLISKKKGYDKIVIKEYEDDGYYFELYRNGELIRNEGNPESGYFWEYSATIEKHTKPVEK